MPILYDLPDIDTFQANRKLEVLAAPPGLYYIEINQTMSKED